MWCPSSQRGDVYWRFFPSAMFSHPAQHVCCKGYPPVFMFFKIYRRLREFVAVGMSLPWLRGSSELKLSQGLASLLSRYSGILGACKRAPLRLSSCILRHSNQAEACSRGHSYGDQWRGSVAPKRILWYQPLMWASCIAQLGLLPAAVKGLQPEAFSRGVTV